MDKGQLQELKESITGAIAESEQRLKVELKEFIETTVSGSEERLRAEFKSEISDLRTELRSEINNLRTEFQAEIRELRAEMQESFKGVAESFERLEKRQGKADRILDRHTSQLNHHGELILQLQNPA